MFNFMAPINHLSYGLVGLNTLLALKRAGVSPTLWPIGPIEALPCHHESIRASIGQQGFYDDKAETVRLYHQFSMAESVGRGTRIGWPIFELTRFNLIETHHLLSLDELIVCSQWAKNIVSDHYVSNKTSIVPLGVDPEIFHPKVTAQDETVRFLNVGKWEYRKGHDVLVEAFNAAFTPLDAVQLYMYCHNPFIGEDNDKWVKMYKSSKLGDKIFIARDRCADYSVFSDMYNACDCFVSPTRAEGWNLPLLEAMACGCHAIATDYGGQTEFATADNCHLISVDKLETAYDGVFFKGDVGEWAEFGQSQLDQLVHYLRLVYNKKRCGELTRSAAGAETGRRLTWDNTAKRLIGAIQ